MFDKLQMANRMNDNGSFPYLRSHPLTTQRIADAQLRLTLSPDDQKPASPSVSPPAAEPLLMGARARVLADPGVDALRAWVAEAASPAQAAALAAQPVPRRAATLYAGILAKLRLKELDGIAPLLSQLAGLTARDAEASQAVSLLASEVALAQGHPERALLVLPPVSNSRAATLMAAQAQGLLGEARLEQAAAALQTWVARNPRDAAAWQLLATLYQRQGQPLRALRAEAESRVAQLDYAGAADRLKAAQALQRQAPRTGPSDNIEASIIDSRSRQVELLFREQALER
jgi:predicted Zn-dependent protease